MPDYIDISILGDRDLEKKLKKLDFKLQRKFVRQSINRAMLPVRDKAKTYVPVDTGKLKASIKRRSRTRRGISRSMIVTGTRAELGIDAGAKYYFPAAIEYGTRKKPERSFLRRAITELKDSVIKNTGKFIDGYIKKTI